MIAKDSSNNNFQLTVAGNTQISTSVKKYGDGSAFFDGSGDYVRGNANINYDNNFTIECWLYRTNSGAVLTIFEAGDIQPAQGGVHLYIDGSGQVVWNNGLVPGLQGGLVPLNQWVHVAAVRYNGTNTLYVDGVSVDSGSQSFPVTNNIITIGGAPVYSFYFPGYIDDFRITTGIARYTTNFTPPQIELADPSDPYIDDVSLLLHGDGSNNSLLITDSSNNNFAVALNGDAKISQTEKKFGTGSIAFDGSGDYLELANNTSFEFGSDSFTIECWIYPTAISSPKAVISKGNASSTGDEVWTLEWSGSNLVFYGPPGLGGIVTTTTSFTTNTWYHVAVTRNGSTYRIFVNGTLEQTTTNSTSIDAGGSLYIGTGWFNPSTRGFTGYIDDLRITKGIARYTSNFIPQTAPFSNRIVTDTVPTAGLVARFMADQGVTESGGIITSWLDQSGNNIVATPFNNPTRIANQMNGRPAVSFNNSEYFTFNLNTTITGARTYIVFGRYRNPTSEGQQGYLAAGLSGSYDRGYMFKNGSEDRAYFYNGSQICSPNITLTKYHVATVVHNGIDNYNFYRMNGNTSTEESYGVMGVFDVNQFVIGGRSLGAEQMRGEIVEILIYNRQLSMIEIEQIEKYAKV